VLSVNGQRAVFPVEVKPGQAVTSEGPGGAKFWPGGMQPGQALDVPTQGLQLRPGENMVTFSHAGEAFPGDVRVLLYRLWPLEE
jgi:hypothetical protein